MPELDSAPLAAVILAGERQLRDALRSHFGVPSKALIAIGGEPMIHRVIGALRRAETVGELWLSGPVREAVEADPRLARDIAAGELAWRPPAATPATSAAAVMAEIPAERRVLLTTADHPMLSPEVVDHFCRESLASGADVTVGLAPYALVQERFPALKKTVLEFRDGDFCGCNLFAFLTPRGRRVADFWRRIENQRKKPMRLIRLLGWWSVVRYRLGLLSLESALAHLSGILDLRIRPVVLPYAHAAVDVDSLDDYQVLAEAAMAAQLP
ncbi:MAG: hypothetical protein KatS3mg124_0369 [Porticoccaceae bacterium]|nr:MAG: hypothetical protein KatS3mg124_0369 [Porticoccaceae bacterium]